MKKKGSEIGSFDIWGGRNYFAKDLEDIASLLAEKTARKNRIFKTTNTALAAGPADRDFGDQANLLDRKKKRKNK